MTNFYFSSTILVFLILTTGVYGDLESQSLASHNRYRKLAGLLDFTWDEGLAKEAQAWAEKLAEKCRMVHAKPKEMKEDAGENLYMVGGTGKSGDVLAKKSAFSWYKEIEDYRMPTHGAPPPNPADYDYEDGLPAYNECSDWKKVGHYTQMMWAKNEALGCGMAECTAKAAQMVVCRYSPGGNMRGEPLMQRHHFETYMKKEKKLLKCGEDEEVEEELITKGKNNQQTSDAPSEDDPEEVDLPLEPRDESTKTTQTSAPPSTTASSTTTAAATTTTPATSTEAPEVASTENSQDAETSDQENDDQVLLLSSENRSDVAEAKSAASAHLGFTTVFLSTLAAVKTLVICH